MKTVYPLQTKFAGGIKMIKLRKSCQLFSPKMYKWPKYVGYPSKNVTVTLLMIFQVGR